MFKICAATLIAGMLLVGCGESQQVSVTPSAVLESFKKAGIPVVKEEIYTAETDSNKLLGRPNQYTAKANWADSRLEQSAEDITGGTVEIFNNEADLNARKDYVEKIGKAMPMLVQYQYQHGLVLIRLDKSLSPAQAAEYEAALGSIK